MITIKWSSESYAHMIVLTTAFTVIMVKCLPTILHVRHMFTQRCMSPHREIVAIQVNDLKNSRTSIHYPIKIAKASNYATRSDIRLRCTHTTQPENPGHL